VRVRAPDEMPTIVPLSVVGAKPIVTVSPILKPLVSSTGTVAVAFGAPGAATVVPAATSSDTSRSMRPDEPSYLRLTSRSSTLPFPGGRGGAPGFEVTRASRSRISNTRAPDAVARCAIPSEMPSVRIGDSSISRYE